MRACEMPRLSRHALDLRYKRRVQWLRAAGITPEALAKAVGTLLAGCDAMRYDADAGMELADWPTRVKSANNLAELCRHTVGLTADTSKPAENKANSVLVVNLPAWMVPPTPQSVDIIDVSQAPPLPPQNFTDASALPIDSGAGAKSGVSEASEVIPVKQLTGKKFNPNPNSLEGLKKAVREMKEKARRDAEADVLPITEEGDRDGDASAG